MPFIIKKYPICAGEKVQSALCNQLGFSLSLSQRLLSKLRVFDHQGNPMQNGQKVTGEFLQIATFEGITKGLKPLFQTEDFAFFDKPSGVMVHPSSRKTEYSLLDEIRYHFGENANLAHRIDQETSGLVLVAKNKISDILLKEMFENKLYEKKYLAVVEGKISKNLEIDLPLKKDTNSSIGVKMCVDKEGKESFTYIKPLQYDSVKNRTLLEAIPITGRQHQIRVHLHHMGHTIIGDPIYGVDEKIADLYLLKKLSDTQRLHHTKNDRLMLHSNYLSFSYQKKLYKIYSKLRLK